MYDHLAQATDKCVSNALLCAQGKGETGHGGFGPSLFSMMGSFPPVRLKIKDIPAGMENIYHPQQISMEEARKGLEQALKHMKEAVAQIKNADKKQRVKHWAGGWFNGEQWYHSAEMHLKHHFRQKKRIDKAFASGKK